MTLNDFVSDIQPLIPISDYHFLNKKRKWLRAYLWQSLRSESLMTRWLPCLPTLKLQGGTLGQASQEDDHGQHQRVWLPGRGQLPQSHHVIQEHY